MLLPGPDSLLAPDWVPWSERVRPGDLGVGDLMPAADDDERLVPAALLEGDDGVLDWDDSASWAGPERRWPSHSADWPPSGRAGRYGRGCGSRSAAGPASCRRSAGTRPRSAGTPASTGPSTPLARAAPGPCVTCGFLAPLAGPLGRVFGVCANEYAPDDGRVVSLDHGCGAHSEAVSARPGFGAIAPVIDEVGYDLVDMPGVALADTVFESLDHES